MVNGNFTSIESSNFTNNHAENTNEARGGAIYIKGIGTNITDSRFEHSRSKLYGGSIYINGDNTTVGGSNFTDCTVDADGSQGGAIYVNGENAVIEGSDFVDSSAKFRGGAIYIHGTKAKVKDSNFTVSSVTGGTYGGENPRGGAIYINEVNATVEGSIFNHSSVSQNTGEGGAIYIEGKDAKILGSEFYSSTARMGGAIYLEGGSCNVSDSLFVDSYADKDGGAMASVGANSTLYNSNFTNNKARHNGGALYWAGGKSSVNNVVDGCIFTNNTAIADASFDTGRVTRGGGAVYWSEYGQNGKILNSEFYYNSVQSTDKADGGAVLWDYSEDAVVDHCIFVGDYVTTSHTGDVWVQGGAMYLRANKNYIISNCLFENCSSSKESGALYIQSKGDSAVRYILVANTTFKNNVAKAIKENSYGGGAVQVKECRGVLFKNVTFINNTANQGGAVSVFKADLNITFDNCTFINNYADKNKVTGTAKAMGGAIYYYDGSNKNLTISDSTFTNNSAELGGALYINKDNAIVRGSNFTLNKAESGSAIYTRNYVPLIDVVLLENRANSDTLKATKSGNNLNVEFKGKDNLLNGIYSTLDDLVDWTNVTYWNEDGVVNTDSTLITSTRKTLESGQNFTVKVFDRAGNLVEGTGTYLTNANGRFTVPFASPAYSYDIFLTNEDYYTYIEISTRIILDFEGFADNVTYRSNATINATLNDDAENVISIYVNGTFVGNVTPSAGKASIEISTLINGTYLEVGPHEVLFVYYGDGRYKPANTTTTLNITKITPIIKIDTDSIGNSLEVNVTVIDAEHNITDATGTVTVSAGGRTVDVHIENGIGTAIISNLQVGQYNVTTHYHGDNHYFDTTNSTLANVTFKPQAQINITVEVKPVYWINETVHISVSVQPNATGNITLYLNGVPHVLQLNNSEASFNATDLQEGTNYVLVTYDGSRTLAPNWADTTFEVIKYTTPVIIDTTNITVGQTEVINITLCNDTEGLLNVTINGVSKYYEIVNGTASIPVSDLASGVYNVTVTFVGDKKYYTATNSTLFNVTKAIPTVIVDVDNITYGEDTVIVVTVPDGAGNVTIKLNGEIEFTEQPIDGQAIFIIKNLPASNYTVEAIFNGNENFTSNSAKKNFTVAKATPIINLTVEDIYYGEVEHIIVTVNAKGNVTIRVAGNETTIVLADDGTSVIHIFLLRAAIDSTRVLETYDGRADEYVYNLAVGKYPVEAIFNGNDNYKSLSITKDFYVYQKNVTFDIEVHDITIWDMEYINVTGLENATGNVTININGVNHTAQIINGTARFSTADLHVGQNTVCVYYGGDRNYTGGHAQKTFNVGQRTPFITVDATNVTVGHRVKITVTVPLNATGYVVVSGKFRHDHVQEYYLDADAFTEDGGIKYDEIFIYDLFEGIYDVHVTYHGGGIDNYTIAVNDTTFIVSKNNATGITVHADNIIYGEKATITVNVPGDIEGTITLRLNDTAHTHITLPIYEHKVTWVVDDLAAGNYTVDVIYNGNDKYYENDTISGKFEVAKVKSVLEIITPHTVDAATNATVIVRVNETATGKIAITVNGTRYEADIEDGVAIFTINKSRAGKYDIIAEYAGDGNNTAAKTATLVEGLTVTKVACYQINVTANDTLVDVETTIVVKVPSDATGSVSIYIDGELAGTADINSGIAELVVTRPYGNHTVNVTFTDDKYGPRYAICDFWVFKHESPLVIAADSIVVGDVAYINVTAPSDNVTIEINGKSYSSDKYENGIAYFTVSGLEHGDKTVVAIYGGSEKYVQNTTTGKFTVDKRASQVNVSVENITVGGIADIVVKVPSDAKGYVVVVVDGVNYTANLTGGIGHVHIKDLANTTYNVNVTYIGDEKYLSSTNSTKLAVGKNNTTLTIAADGIYYGETAVINVTVAPSDAAGFITVRLSNGKSVTLPVVEGKVQWNVSGLAAGTYTIYANYSGDGKYNLNNSNKVIGELEVSPISPQMSVVKVISEAGKNATVIVRIDSRVSDNVTVTVDGKPYSVKPNADGVAVVTTDILENGTHTLSVSYACDNNFTEATSDQPNFVTNKTSDYVMNITAYDIKYGNATNITVNVPVDAKGIVIVNINGTDYTATITDGKAVFNENIRLAEGRYNITAYFGNKKYENKTATGVFYVSRHETPMTIEDITAIKVGDKAIVKVTAPSDVLNDIYIEIDGVKYTDHTVSEGKAVFEVPIMSNGTRTVVATYDGGNKYSFNSSTQKFDVGKRNSYVKVDVINTTVGSGAFINVTVPANATGYVIVKVDNTNYTINLTGGKGNVTVYNLENKTYDVTVTYIGDYQYLSSINATKLAIDKLTTTFEVNGTNITVGAAEFIRFETPDNITGLVKVEINDKNYTAFVNEGKGNLTVCGLEAGDYNVTVYFEGNYKYLPAASAKNKFTVNQTTAEIVIIPQNITYGETETIIIYVNATGKVNVTVVNRDVEDYKVTDEPIVDGKVTIVVPGYLTAGNYTVKVDYSGNVNVSNASAQEDFEVAKADPIMTVSVQNITYGDVEHIRATVNAEGNITIKVNGKETTIVLENGNLVIGVLSARVNQIAQFDGKAGVDVSGLEVGEYPVEVTFNGNENYNKLTINTKFLVTKDNVTVSVQVEDIRTDGKEVINVTLSNTNVTGNVTINVDGINYTRPIKDGKANLTLDKLSNATHSVVVIYEGDRNFNGNWTSDTFNVTKVEPEISVDVANKKVGETERIVVHLPDNATGYVVIDVDGTEYHVDIVAGQEISIEIDNLENKTYDVNVYYSGDGYWQSTTSSDSFNVSKVKSSINITVIHDGIIPNGTDVDIFIKAPGDITGKVNVTVWDTVRDENTTYTVYVNEGNGTLHIETPLDGIYKVNATYLENGKYLGSENYTSFDVYNTRKPLSVNSDNGYVNENEPIYVTVQGNHVDEYLTVVISNSSGEIKRNETVRFNNYDSIHNISSALWKLQPLDAGHYDVKAIYIEHDGDKVYTYEGVNDFNIWKLASEIKIKEIKNITVGENATIELEIELDPRVNDGNISVFVDGREYMTNTSTLKVIVPGLGADNYTVEAIYHGNRWYNESSATSAFKVQKNPAPISITVTNSKVGEIEQINVTLSENITGRVLLDIGDNHYYANITDGVAIFNITKLDAGKYNVTATYDGNYKYFANSTNSTLEITKWDSFVNVTADNITYGDKAVILVETPKDLCGNVTVSVDGENYTVFVSGGHGTLVVPGLNVGPHDVNVTFDGCNKYEPSNNNTIFNVNKVDLNEVDMKVIDYGNGTAVVVLPGNATGNVTIKIDDKEFYAKVVNGTAVVQLDNVTPGTHVAEVIYSGDDKYNATTKMANITAPKYESPINITVGEIVAGENGTIIVSVLENATGNVTVSVGGKQYYGEIKDGVAVVEDCC